MMNMCHVATRRSAIQDLISLTSSSSLMRGQRDQDSSDQYSIKGYAIRETYR